MYPECLRQIRVRRESLLGARIINIVCVNYL